jgi:MFS family permease
MATRTLPSSLRPLRSRNYALVWTAALVSNVGSWMQTVALGFVITRNTHDPLWTGAVAAAAFVPVGLLSPVGGAMADRLDRRRWLTTTTVAEAVLAGALAVAAASGHEAPWLLVLLAFAGGAASAIGFPTYQAMLPDLVPSEDLLGAVSLSSAQYNLGRVVGPALAGVVLVAGGAAWTFAANAISFAAVVVALALVRLPARPPAATAERLADRLRHGARTTWDLPACRSAVVLIGVVALLGSPFIALVPAMVVDALHRGAAGTSTLVTGQGVGAVVGALALAPAAAAWGRGPTVRLALVALPLALVAYGQGAGLWPTAAAIALVGACYIGVLSGLNTVVQLAAPAEVRGRVLGIYMMTLGIGYPVGALVQGALAQSIGVRAVTVASAATLLVVLAAVALVRRSWLSALGPRRGTPWGEETISPGDPGPAHQGPGDPGRCPGAAGPGLPGPGLPGPGLPGPGMPGPGGSGPGAPGRGVSGVPAPGPAAPEAVA